MILHYIDCMKPYFTLHGNIMIIFSFYRQNIDSIDRNTFEGIMMVGSVTHTSGGTGFTV